MNKPLQTPTTESGRLNHLLDLVLVDALRICEKEEEEYETCAKLLKKMNELKNK